MVGIRAEFSNHCADLGLVASHGSNDYVVHPKQAGEPDQVIDPTALPALRREHPEKVSVCTASVQDLARERFAVPAHVDDRNHVCQSSAPAPSLNLTQRNHADARKTHKRANIPSGGPGPRKDARRLGDVPKCQKQRKDHRPIAQHPPKLGGHSVHELPGVGARRSHEFQHQRGGQKRRRGDRDRNGPFSGPQHICQTGRQDNDQPVAQDDPAREETKRFDAGRVCFGASPSLAQGHGRQGPAGLRVRPITGRAPRPAVYVELLHEVTACQRSCAASKLPILITGDGGRPYVSESAL